MVLEVKRMTAEEFDQYAALPENVERVLEYIGGEIYDVPSNAFASFIAGLILTFINNFIRERGIAGYVTGEAGGYMVAGERYAPDVAFISAARQPELAKEGYNPNPPELAVEVEFPVTPESGRKLLRKMANYLSVGTLLWVVYPETKTVEVYAPGQPVRVLDVNGTLDGGDVLPGFTLAVKAIFSPSPE